MNLDWIILHGLRVLTTCPLLDFWMPRITALGNSAGPERQCCLLRRRL